MYNLITGVVSAAGVKRSTLLRAINGGRIRGRCDATGGWAIGPREIRRPPLVGMQFLHEGVVRPRLQAKDLIDLLFRHFAAPPLRTTRPRCRVTLHVLAPSGRPAVHIRQQ
jgi:hypothetical protein